MIPASERIRRRSASIALALGSALVLCASPGTARAAEEAPRLLSSDAQAAVAADLDHDGTREIVLISGGNDRLLTPTLELWDHLAHGWVRVAAAPVVRPDTTGGPPLALRPEEEAFGLLAWRDEIGERVLFVSAGDAGDYGGGCCLALGSVEMKGGGLGIRPLLGPAGRTESVAVLDADADGIDELLVTEPPGGANDRHASLLRWTGDAFVSERVALGGDDGSGRPMHVGETDGVAGDEAVFAVEGGRSLLRIGLAADGTTIVERAALDDAPDVHLWSWGAAGGALVVQVGTELRVLEWPRGGEPATAAAADRSEYPTLSVVGAGREAVIVDEGVGRFDPRRDAPHRIFDLGLREVAELRPAQAVTRLWTLANIEMGALQTQRDRLMPYHGPLPGRLPGGGSAYISAGNLVSVDRDAGLEVRPISSLTGLLPVGIAGTADDPWWVVATGFVGRPDTVDLVIDSDPGRSITVVPAAMMLEPEPDDGVLAVDLTDAIVTRAADGADRLIVDGSGFRATVEGIPGSLVIGVIDQWIVHVGILPDEPVSLELESQRPDRGNQPIEVAIVLIDPAGRASSIRWEGDVLREPPQVVAHASTDTFAANATVSGRASAGATVTVDGRVADLNRYGAFHARVDAAIWPREVLVVARDLAGNETVSRLEVVGFVDYRGLPWAALFGIGTLASGAFLFVRTPRRRPIAVAPAGDGSLEEIDAGNA